MFYKSVLGDYLQNHCQPNSNSSCVACEDRLPSCKTLKDGNNPYPDRPISEYYINCVQNRTVSVEACQVSRYDPVRRKCSTTIDPGMYNFNLACSYESMWFTNRFSLSRFKIISVT